MKTAVYLILKWIWLSIKSHCFLTQCAQNVENLWYIDIWIRLIFHLQRMCPKPTLHRALFQKWSSFCQCSYRTIPHQSTSLLLQVWFGVDIPHWLVWPAEKSNISAVIYSLFNFSWCLLQLYIYHNVMTHKDVPFIMHNSCDQKSIYQRKIENKKHFASNHHAGL